jgi:hypothetical protein
MPLPERQCSIESSINTTAEILITRKMDKPHRQITRTITQSPAVMSAAVSSAITTALLPRITTPTSHV